MQSDIKAYQLYLDAIKIQFADGSIYLYTNDNTGAEIVGKMKILAAEGQGLETFIRESVGNDSAQQLE